MIANNQNEAGGSDFFKEGKEGETLVLTVRCNLNLEERVSRHAETPSKTTSKATNESEYAAQFTPLVCIRGKRKHEHKIGVPGRDTAEQT